MVQSKYKAIIAIILQGWIAAGSSMFCSNKAQASSQFALQSQSQVKIRPQCQIVVSFSILQDLVYNIVGHRCSIASIVGPNQDAHIFEPKPSANRLIHAADVVIMNGLGFENWMERLLKATHYQGPIITAANRIIPHYVHLPNNAKPVPDPHAWHAINNAIAYITEITDNLCQIFPYYAAEFKRNALSYQWRLQQLDQGIRQQLSTLPSAKRRVITAHDAFGYLSAEYDIEFLSPLGISTDSDPSAKHIANLIDQIKKFKIKAIFVENISNDKLIKQLMDETGLTVSGKLYSDALSTDDEPASTYFKLMQHNMLELIKAMNSNASESTKVIGIQ